MHDPVDDVHDGAADDGRTNHHDGPSADDHGSERAINDDFNDAAGRYDIIKHAADKYLARLADRVRGDAARAFHDRLDSAGTRPNGTPRADHRSCPWCIAGGTDPRPGTGSVADRAFGVDTPGDGGG